MPTRNKPHILDHLNQAEAGRTWHAHLESLDSDIPDFQMPSPEKVVDVLLDLAVPHEDIGPLIAHLPCQERDADAWWVLERAAASVAKFMGSFDNPPRMPELPSNDPFLRYFYVYVFLAVKPMVEAWHCERGIPADVSRRSLADLGRNMAVHRKRYGTGGFNLQNWMQLHFHGAIYQLGRLQFQRAKLSETTGNAIRTAGQPFGPGDLTLSVHIPDFCGPFAPDLCDDSFARAKTFFADHFPDELYQIATCHSWLLDPQLENYLPETSNIIQFLRRFTIVDRKQEPAGNAVFEFVFGRKAAEIDILPRNTSIQRTLIDHVRSGKHWYIGSGWLLL